MISSSKMYYSISEVCRDVGLEQHVLRYWESEFPTLRPKKNRAGNRAYRKKEIELVKYIKFLLYEKQYTIQGAKKVLSEQKSVDMTQVVLEAEKPLTVSKQALEEIRHNLVQLLADMKESSKLNVKVKLV